jgi:hypothetical protein
MSYRVELEEREYDNILKIFIDDEEYTYSDYGEPEDNSFYRDYYWIEMELEKAYKKGLEDAINSRCAANKS